VRKALAERGATLVADGADSPQRPEPAVVIDIDPTGESVATGLAALGPTGTLVVAGRVEPVDIDVQSDIHKRGATVVGVAPGAGEPPGRRWEDG
jgi:hypothetical protein